MTTTNCAMDRTSIHNVCALLKKLSREHPSRPAIIEARGDELRTATFSQLEAEVSEAARLLQDAGVRSMDVVLVYVPLQRELISLLLGIFRLGAQALFIDPSYGPDRVWHCLRLARPKVLVLDHRLQALNLASPLLSLLGIDGLVTFTSAAAMGMSTKLKIVKMTKADKSTDRCLSETAIAGVSPDHPALITFTSGSTGKPKGIVRTHGFLNKQSALLQKTLPTNNSTARDGEQFTVMTGLPMFILAALADGQTAVIPSSQNALLLKQLKTLEIDRLLFAPHSLQLIGRLLTEEKIALPGIKQIVVGGGPVFPSLIGRLRVCMPGAQIITVYGSTEAEPISHRTLPEDLHLKQLDQQSAVTALPLGRPIDEIEVCIIAPGSLEQRLALTACQFEAVKMPVLGQGEIVISGAHVVPGYIGGLGDSETKFKVDGRIFHRTGDAGYLDANGELFLTGRAAYGLKIDNATVYPLSIELQAMQNAAVERCAFVCVGGKTILALTLESGSVREDVLAELKAAFSAAGTKIDRFIVVESLPVDERHGSKIVYARLKRQLRFAW